MIEGYSVVFLILLLRLVDLNNFSKTLMTPWPLSPAATQTGCMLGESPLGLQVENLVTFVPLIRCFWG